MGQGKLEIMKITNKTNRQNTFAKRKNGLQKKASELAILCDAKVALIIYSCEGKVFDCAYNNSMKEILLRYQKSPVGDKIPALENGPEDQGNNDVGGPKEETEKLKAKQQQMLGKDLSSLSLEDLRVLEQQLNEGLLCIKDRKEQILKQQLAHSRMQEQQALIQNEDLRRQVGELRVFLPPSTSHQVPVSFEYPPTVNLNFDKKSSDYPKTDGHEGEESSVSTLRLQLGITCWRKRKTPESETQSDDSEI